MLRELLVQDFALIDRVEVEFVPGFTVLTGETGAGKSILIDALSLALGGRAHADQVRDGAAAARVEAVFEGIEGIPAVSRLLEEWGIEAGPELVLGREVGTGGRSRARLNGRPVTASQLAEVGSALLAIHGQNQQHQLLSPARQRELLDAFAGPELGRLLEAYRQRYEAACHLAEQVRVGSAGEEERRRRRELLEFQLAEIDGARLVPGEEEQLQEEAARLGAVERLRALAGEAWALLGGEGGSPADAGTLLGRAADRLGQAALVDPSLAPVADGVAAATRRVAEAVRDLGRYLDTLEADPGRLAAVQERLALIGRLRAKYGGSVAAVLAWREQAARELASLRTLEGDTGAARARLEGLLAELSALAERLTHLRQEAGRELARRVEAELAELAMPHARFEVLFEPERAGLFAPAAGGEGREGWLGPAGRERVEFRLAANPGEAGGELARVASGGELSRVMLALEATLADADPVPTLIFDEIDAGVGGRTAQAVAARLARLACCRQVICVTHLPQIASVASSHYRVEKHAGARTRVTVQRLDTDGRVEELARMVGGARLTRTALDHARELLRLGEQVRPTG